MDYSIAAGDQLRQATLRFGIEQIAGQQFDIVADRLLRPIERSDERTYLVAAPAQHGHQRPAKDTRCGHDKRLHPCPPYPIRAPDSARAEQYAATSAVLADAVLRTHAAWSERR